MQTFVAAVLVWLSAAAAFAQSAPPRGVLVDDIACADAPDQHYALYLPSNYSPAHEWPLILGFDAGGRGRRAVERYQAAAEQYGFIVAGSNNSRNGAWEPTVMAAAAMSRDIETRYVVNAKRVYTAGMSGGARVAMTLAQDFPDIAGVFASSAGFLDKFEEAVRFPVFASMGTDDFNHYEMYRLDRDLTSPHLVIEFQGGHEWLPVEAATAGVEWMELQAMKRGLREKDQALVHRWFTTRVARAEAETDRLRQMRAFQGIAADFDGLDDVAPLAARAGTLARSREVKDALKAEEAENEREIKVTREAFGLRDDVAAGKKGALAKITALVDPLVADARAEADSSRRRVARRALASLASSSRAVGDPGYQELMRRVRPASPAFGAEEQGR